MRPRVVISGLGTLSSAGTNLEEARANFAAGKCCLSPISDPRIAHFKARYAGLLHEFDTVKAGLPVELSSADKHIQMAVVAAREALDMAGARPAELGRRLGLIFSTCSGPMLLIEAHYERILRGEPQISQEELFAKRYYSGARILAHVLGIEGLSTTVVTACTAGTSAIALAADLIRSGQIEAALAGGADAFSTSTLAGFDGLKATTDGCCAPFSKPYGLNLGEAATFVFLETAESAQKRAARIRAEILGSGLSNDAYHCSSPEPSGRGLAAAMRRALADAGLPPEAISYINAHGTGTEANDKAETRAVRTVFGARAEQIPISSTKSMIGHCLGAAGVIEAVASIACAEAGVFPPTANFAGPREGCGLDCVPDAGRKWPSPRTFLSSNLAFGGHNASLVIALPGSERSGQSPGPSAAHAPICVTACGVVSSLGLGSAALLEGVKAGRCGAQPMSLPGLDPVQAALVDAAAVEKFDRRLDLRHMDRSSRWATVATRLAMREAAFPAQPSALAELGLFLNLAAGPSWAESEFLTSFLGHNRQVSQLLAFPYIVPCSVAGNVCRALRLTGHNLTLNGGPGAGLLGLGPAVAALQSGHSEAILSGAVDELSERIVSDNVLAGNVSTDKAPPGEGAAVLLLETLRHAEARAAKPLATIRGLAFSTEIAHWHQPNPTSQSLEETVRAALAQAGLAPEGVSALCAYGPQARLEQLMSRVCPAWGERVVSVARHTGCLEGAQPLVDVAMALGATPATPAKPSFILAVASSPHGVNGAVVFEAGANGQ